MHLHGSRADGPYHGGLLVALCQAATGTSPRTGLAVVTRHDFRSSEGKTLGLTDEAMENYALALSAAMSEDITVIVTDPSSVDYFVDRSVGNGRLSFIPARTATDVIAAAFTEVEVVMVRKRKEPEEGGGERRGRRQRGRDGDGRPNRDDSEEGREEYKGDEGDDEVVFLSTTGGDTDTPRSSHTLPSGLSFANMTVDVSTLSAPLVFVRWDNNSCARDSLFFIVFAYSVQTGVWPPSTKEPYSVLNELFQETLQTAQQGPSGGSSSTTTQSDSGGAGDGTGSSMATRRRKRIKNSARQDARSAAPTKVSILARKAPPVTVHESESAAKIEKLKALSRSMAEKLQAVPMPRDTEELPELGKMVEMEALLKRWPFLLPGYVKLATWEVKVTGGGSTLTHDPLKLNGQVPPVMHLTSDAKDIVAAIAMGDYQTELIARQLVRRLREEKSLADSVECVAEVSLTAGDLLYFHVKRPAEDSYPIVDTFTIDGKSYQLLAAAWNKPGGGGHYRAQARVGGKVIEYEGLGWTSGRLGATTQGPTAREADGWLHNKPAEQQWPGFKVAGLFYVPS